MRLYFDSFEHLENFISCTEYSSRIHSSARGYQSVKSFYVESYSGRYGKGLIAHYPSRLGFGYGRKSNRYHRIDYIIF